MLFLFADPTGSPLQARQNGIVNAVPIFIAIGVILVCAVIAIIIQAVRRMHQRPEWIEAQKQKPTTPAIVNKTAKRFGLTLDEKNILWDACKAVNAPNIFYLVRDSEAVDDLLRRQYMSMKSRNKSANAISSLFSLRFKLEAGSTDITSVNSTYKLSVNQMLVLYKNEDTKFPMRIMDVEKEGIYLELHPALRAPEARPKPLSRLGFTFLTKSNSSFAFITRIIRYTEKHDIPQMLIAHTNSVKSQERRNDKRATLNIDTEFSAVKVSTQLSHSKTELQFTPSEKQHHAKIHDISAGGCRIIANLPIKEEQYVCLKFKLQGEPCELIGLILETNKSKEGDSYLLQVRFVKMTPEIKNLIMAAVYNYG